MSESANVFAVTEQQFATRVIEASREKPVVVDFWAPWCGPCQSLMPMLTAIVESYGGQVLLAKVNTDEEQNLAGQYGIRSLPTVMVFKDGRPVDQFMGVQPESEIRALINRHVTRESDLLRRKAAQVYAAGAADQALELLREANRQDPDNADVVLDIARIMGNQGAFEEASEILSALPVAMAERDDVKELKAQLRLASQAVGAPDRSELVARIEADPGDLEAREKLSSRLAMEGDHAGAAEQMYQIMLRDRGYNDDAGRKGLLEIFEMLGPEHPVTRQYRSRMFGLLY
ncbi:MAG: thioredoxin [Halothiobacillaceae bacterium]